MPPRAARPGQLTCVKDDCAHAGFFAAEGHAACGGCGGRLEAVPSDPSVAPSVPAPREQAYPAPSPAAPDAWAGGPVSVGTDAWAGRPVPAGRAVAEPGAPPTIGDRFLARLIDTGIQLGILLVLGGCANAFEDAAQPLRTLIGLTTLAALYGYEFAMLGHSGQTVGKRVMKLRVIKLSGEPIGWGAAAARVLVPMLLSCVTCGIGGLLFALSPLFDSGPWKRGWPDQIASTIVIRDGG